VLLSVERAEDTGETPVLPHNGDPSVKPSLRGAIVRAAVSSAAMHPYPLALEPILKEKVWGGRRLETLGKALPAGASVGESWELADLQSTSPDGGGGESARTSITNGPMRGLSVHEAITAMGANLLGNTKLTSEGNFPLLVKYLDAKENLSVQVHPSPEYAAAHPEAHLKTESWYIVAADPGSRLYKGIKDGVGRDEFAARIKDGTVQDVLNAIDAVPGDLHHLPSGVCHALGAGVLVAEVQTPSDTTFRVFDWGRTDRTLHIEPALECIDFCGALAHDATRWDGSERCRLLETEFYVLTEARYLGNTRTNVRVGTGARVIMVLSGEGRIESESGAFQPVPLSAGRTILLPDAMDTAHGIFTRDTVVLEARIPSE